MSAAFCGPNSPVARPDGFLFGQLAGLTLSHWIRGTVNVSIGGSLLFNGRDLLIIGAAGLRKWAGWRVAAIEYQRPGVRSDEFTRVDRRPMQHLFGRRPRLEPEGQAFRLSNVRMDLNQLGHPVEMVS